MGNPAIALVLSAVLIVTVPCHPVDTSIKQPVTDRNDFFHPNAESVTYNLLNKNLRIGMSYTDLKKFLRSPDRSQDLPPNTLAYDLTVRYGSGIDPVSHKRILIELTPDSLLKSFRIENWQD
jgi:hypothetical protein